MERHGNQAEFDLTLVPAEAGLDFLGHGRQFKIPFEVALMGATTKWGHGLEESRNIRMLGRFLIPTNLQPDIIDPKWVAPELNKWQWEVVLNPTGRTLGFVTRLDAPLPKAWTM